MIESCSGQVWCRSNEQNPCLLRWKAAAGSPQGRFLTVAQLLGSNICAEVSLLVPRLMFLYFSGRKPRVCKNIIYKNIIKCSGWAFNRWIGDAIKLAKFFFTQKQVVTIILLVSVKCSQGTDQQHLRLTHTSPAVDEQVSAQLGMSAACAPVRCHFSGETWWNNRRGENLFANLYQLIVCANNLSS